MNDPSSEGPALIRHLRRYVDLEADSVEAYALAACRLHDLADVDAAGEFRRRHEAQRDELSRLLARAGGEVHDPFKARRPVTGDWRLIGAAATDEEVLAVLREGERARASEYEATLRSPDTDRAVSNALERGLFACRTRLRWLERRTRPAPELRAVGGERARRSSAWPAAR